MEEMEKELVVDYHIVTVEELCKRFHTDITNGLTDTQAAEGLKQHGHNALTPLPTTPEWVKLVKCFFSSFALLLWIGVIFCFVVYGNPPVDSFSPEDTPVPILLALGILLTIVLVMTSIFAYCQQTRIAKNMEGVLNPEPQYVLVRRNGKKVFVKVTDLTLGDIVQISNGQMCPADVRIIQSEGLRVDNSSLTGESEPQSRCPENTHENPLETKNIAFASTNIVEGSAVAMVVEVGDKTVMGRIAHLAYIFERGETLINREIGRLNLIVNAVVIVLGVVALIITLILSYHWLQAATFLICIIMANVPVGLLATLKVCFNLAVKRMEARNCRVKNMEAVETLSCTTCICTNKTGTLTQNRMTVVHMWFGSKIVEISGDQCGTDIDMNSAGMKALERVAALCSRAEFQEDQDNIEVFRRLVIGDATEAAILKYTELTMGNVIAYRARNKKVCEVPFNSNNKFQVSIHETEDPNEKRYLLVMKGAAEKILEMCSTIMVDGTERPLSQDLKTSFDNVYNQCGGLGETLIGFCDLMLPADEYPEGYNFDPDEIPMQGFRFVGVMSLRDCVRNDVPDAVLKCRSAGIKVIMVTGDHPITALAIAQSVGIVPQAEVNPKVVAGQEMNDLSMNDLDEILMNHREIVFARIRPHHKLVIVEALHRAEAIIAITGENMGDTPALKTADIGAALGINSSYTCTQAADVILLDDSFASIISGVEEGRLYFDNLKKNFAYTLPSIIPEIILFIMFILVDIPIILGTVTILYIVLGSLVVPVWSLCGPKICGKRDGDVMKQRQPRNSATDTVVTRSLILSAVIRKVSSVLLSAIVAVKMPTMILSWIAIRMILYVFLSWVEIRKMSSDFPSRMVVRDEMSLFVCPEPGRLLRLFNSIIH